VKRYIEDRVKPGSFLQAVICNNLKESFGRADEDNTVSMPEIVMFFWIEAPPDCWGSPEIMKEWLEGRK
jgi:hypothetical protein